MGWFPNKGGQWRRATGRAPVVCASLVLAHEEARQATAALPALRVRASCAPARRPAARARRWSWRRARSAMRSPRRRRRLHTAGARSRAAGASRCRRISPAMSRRSSTRSSAPAQAPVGSQRRPSWTLQLSSRASPSTTHKPCCRAEAVQRFRFVAHLGSQAHVFSSLHVDDVVAIVLDWLRFTMLQHLLSSQAELATYRGAAMCPGVLWLQSLLPDFKPLRHVFVGGRSMLLRTQGFTRVRAFCEISAQSRRYFSTLLGHAHLASGWAVSLDAGGAEWCGLMLFESS